MSVYRLTQDREVVRYNKLSTLGDLRGKCIAAKKLAKKGNNAMGDSMEALALGILQELGRVAPAGEAGPVTENVVYVPADFPDSAAEATRVNKADLIEMLFPTKEEEGDNQ